MCCFLESGGRNLHFSRKPFPYLWQVKNKNNHILNGNIEWYSFIQNCIVNKAIDIVSNSADSFLANVAAEDMSFDTMVIPKTKSPKWKQNFLFSLSNGMSSLQVKVKDDSEVSEEVRVFVLDFPQNFWFKNDQIGVITIPLSMIEKRTTIDQYFSLIVPAQIDFYIRGVISLKFIYKPGSSFKITVKEASNLVTSTEVTPQVSFFTKYFCLFAAKTAIFFFF